MLVATLLRYMHQLMCKQLLTLGGVGCVLPGVKYDVPPNSVGRCMDSLRGIFRACIGVNTYTAEIMSEARLHESARGGVQRLPRRAEDLLNDRWNLTHYQRASGCALGCSLVSLATRFTLVGAECVVPAGAYAV